MTKEKSMPYPFLDEKKHHIIKVEEAIYNKMSASLKCKLGNSIEVIKKKENKKDESTG